MELILDLRQQWTFQSPYTAFYSVWLHSHLLCTNTQAILPVARFLHESRGQHYSPSCPNSLWGLGLGVNFSLVIKFTCTMLSSPHKCWKSTSNKWDHVFERFFFIISLWCACKTEQNRMYMRQSVCDMHVKLNKTECTWDKTDLD